ncbi:MAG TPA: hypothetical protein VJ499_11810 [Flavisolibacter sp.]|nr:hypothetical protein [Flavisolibacter sp.]
MKCHTTLCIAICTLLTANYSYSQSNSSMKGAYSLTRQMVNDGNKDSVMQIQQLKIYTDKYMIYAHPLSGDSLADYGIGTYKLENGKVLEYVFYTSTGGAHNDTIKLDITKKGNGYSQLINFPSDSGRTFILVEDYDNVSKSVKTPIDGAWKQTQSIYVPKNGKADTSKITQFKVYESGHFIWANTVNDSATNKPKSAFGYGTFEMKGNKQLVELNTNSTYRTDLVQKPATLQIDWQGKDAFKQTIIWPNGDKLIEQYDRLK